MLVRVRRGEERERGREREGWTYRLGDLHSDVSTPRDVTALCREGYVCVLSEGTAEEGSGRGEEGECEGGLHRLRLRGVARRDEMVWWGKR